MTTQTAVLASPSGMTLTAKLFTLAAPDTEVTGNAITVTERTNAKGQYVASIVRVSALPAGDYTLILFSGSVPVAVGGRTFVGTDLEVATTTPETAVLDSASRVKLDAVQPDYAPATPANVTAAQVAIIAEVDANEVKIDAVAVQNTDLLSLVEAITISGAAAAKEPTSSTLVTGNLSSGTFADVATPNGVYHVITDAGGVIDQQYEIQLDAAQIGVELVFRGRINSANDSVAVQVYNWVGAVWETLWTQVGVGGTVDTNRAEKLLARHTGTGADDGKIRVRFYGTGLTSATLYVDLLLAIRAVTQFDLTPAALSDIVTEFATGSTLTALATQASVNTIDDFLDTEIAAIKAKTDQFVFTTANKVDATAVLDSATQTKINKIEAATSGTVTGAGTSTEVFVGPSATLTITVDASGNRSAVVVT